MENAGGSQAPRCVVDAVRDHMLHSYAQLGAGYAASNRATKTVDEAHDVIKTFMNAHGVGEVVLGHSSSQLFAMLADCYRRCKLVRPGDEIIIHEAAHEANAGPWVRLAEETGATLQVWRISRTAPYSSSPAELHALLTPRTKILALVHVSNLLGEVLDLPELMRLVRSSPAGKSVKVVADGVAYAPHLAIDVAEWGVDWYGFSPYKTWGPHMGALYGSHAAFTQLENGGPNHFWIPGNEVPYKFELGGVSHEGCAGLVALSQYLRVMASGADSKGTDMAANGKAGTLTRSTVDGAYAHFAAMEAPLQERLLSYLLTKPCVSIFGGCHSRTGERVPTISFTHATKPPSQIAAAIQAAGFAVRHGHNYAVRPLQALAADRPDDWPFGWEEGVVRISMLHYNTPAEVENLVAALEGIL
ncbi:hypothetical protein WJX72_006467 [[Myrmecia] bisecta]|uniref:Aminotransferase class V domain-containing protein n=1 Tax=[Myrmecia] bisecta TaxID=41462 RepID=A0AAW1R7E1_9CHLO